MPKRIGLNAKIGLAALLVGFVAGWYVNGLRLNSHYMEQFQEISVGLIAAHGEALGISARLRNENEETQRETAKKNAELDVLQGANSDLAERLRSKASDLAARSRLSCPAAERPPTVDAIGVLTELFAVSDALAGKYAYEADAARIAGQGCENHYDSIMRTQKSP